MGCVAGCLRSVYHRCSPYFHRRGRIHPEKLPSHSFRGESSNPRRILKDAKQTLIAQTRHAQDNLPASSQECLWSVLDQRIPQFPKQSRTSKETQWSTVYCYVVSAYEDFHTVCSVQHTISPTRVLIAYFLSLDLAGERGTGPRGDSYSLYLNLVNYIAS